MKKSDPNLKLIFERILYDLKEMEDGFKVLSNLEGLVKSSLTK